VTALDRIMAASLAGHRLTGVGHLRMQNGAMSVNVYMAGVAVLVPAAELTVVSDYLAARGNDVTMLLTRTAEPGYAKALARLDADQVDPRRIED
jgi:hypothetical protein